MEDKVEWIVAMKREIVLHAQSQLGEEPSAADGGSPSFTVPIIPSNNNYLCPITFNAFIHESFHSFESYTSLKCRINALRWFGLVCCLMCPVCPVKALCVGVPKCIPMRRNSLVVDRDDSIREMVSPALLC